MLAPRALTPRQLEIAGLVAEGCTNNEIAAALALVEGTVANHVEHIKARLGLRNWAHLAAWYARYYAAPPGTGGRLY